MDRARLILTVVLGAVMGMTPVAYAQQTEFPNARPPWESASGGAVASRTPGRVVVMMSVPAATANLYKCEQKDEKAPTSQPTIDPVEEIIQKNVEAHLKAGYIEARIRFHQVRADGKESFWVLEWASAPGQVSFKEIGDGKATFQMVASTEGEKVKIQERCYLTEEKENYVVSLPEFLGGWSPRLLNDPCHYPRIQSMVEPGNSWLTLHQKWMSPEKWIQPEDSDREFVGPRKLDEPGQVKDENGVVHVCYVIEKEVSYSYKRGKKRRRYRYYIDRLSFLLVKRYEEVFVDGELVAKRWELRTYGKVGGLPPKGKFTLPP